MRIINIIANKKYSNVFLMKNFIYILIFLVLSNISCENKIEIDKSELGNYKNGIYYSEVGYWNPETEWSGIDYRASVEIYNNKVIKIIACDENKAKIIINPFTPAPVRKEGYCNLIDDSGTEYTIQVIENLKKRKERIADEKKIADEEHARQVEINIKNQRIGDSIRESRYVTNHDGNLFNGETQDDCIKCGYLISRNNETNQTFCWVCRTENDLIAKNIAFTAEDIKIFKEIRKIQKKLPGYDSFEAKQWMIEKLIHYGFKSQGFNSK